MARTGWGRSVLGQQRQPTPSNGYLIDLSLDKGVQMSTFLQRVSTDYLIDRAEFFHGIANDETVGEKLRQGAREYFHQYETELVERGVIKVTN